jgi:hypothetical protein
MNPWRFRSIQAKNFWVFFQNNMIFRVFFLVLWEKVAKFSHPGCTGKLSFWECLRIFEDIWGYLGFLRIFKDFWIFFNVTKISWNFRIIEKEFQNFFIIIGFLRNFKGFWGVFVIFGNISEIFGFFLVLWEKVAEFGLVWSALEKLGFFRIFKGF